MNAAAEASVCCRPFCKLRVRGHTKECLGLPSRLFSNAAGIIRLDLAGVHPSIDNMKSLSNYQYNYENNLENPTNFHWSLLTLVETGAETLENAIL